ncbi:MAG: YggS family pyridoxal phosphate-dependent enzyme [Candidatus Dadabacteria bacterium]|nr:YggS family pyridoxal phosphate-dependent enzyme [Candidatus Dadabacteria bacterium]NIS07814.1 YggS family pyridoxal phosphate-dependent enzyme [Candidatus Dadabacteria bacterium]NIV43034.1 YggS family pyridoxal phosphate-dependent enzyme [Candidatus Dadabacteria bacterium]NIY21432.1 YggS family pyridoxal phosphate-dependent enzyme [Candidatus Dadabacteria bacterium]
MGIKEALEAINNKITKALEKSGRKASDITLLAVSKQVEAARIKEAIESGHRSFGENYVQEFVSKYEELSDYKDIDWHFIGHLQKNKVKYIIDKVSLIHSLDKLSLAEEINKRAEKLGITMPILVEVNLGGEASKSGIEPSELGSFLEQISVLEHIKLSGLMALPPYCENAEDSRKYFIKLRELRDGFNSSYTTLTELSMGMSHDYEIALEEGATIVRVGTAIFGERPKKKY